MKKYLLSLLILSSTSLAIAQKRVTVQQGDLKLSFDTRVTIDGALYLPSTNTNGWQWGNEDFRFSNGANITQARFGVWGTIGDKWKGKIDLKVVDGKVSLQDVFFDYITRKNTYIRAGYYIDPVSVEINGASNYLSINTPTAISMLAHQTRFLSLSLTNYSKHHYLVAGLYGSSLGGNRTLANRANDGWGITLKGAYLPINEDQNTIYIGAYARHRTPDVSITGKSDELRYATHPGSTIDGRNFISTTVKGVKSYELVGGELAITRGRFHLMGEYLMNYVHFDRKEPLYGNRSHAIFHGGYLTASVMLKGKQRKYYDYWGIFSPLANVQKGGSLELLGRVSYTNGNDKSYDENGNLRESASILMGKSVVSTLGINWYPHSNILIGVNYNYTQLDQYARAGGQLSAPNGKEKSGFNFHTLQCRVQYSF